jgi:hypothetical protein
MRVGVSGISRNVEEIAVDQYREVYPFLDEFLR